MATQTETGTPLSNTGVTSRYSPKKLDVDTLFSMALAADGFLINRPAVDWLTLTTYEQAAAEPWAKLVRENGVLASIRQYRGRAISTKNGRIFVGEAMQKDRPHYMVVISSGLADDLAPLAVAQATQGTINCKRLDVQVSIPIPPGWSQFDLLNELHAAGHNVGWQESRDAEHGRLETVYIGSRSSDRFNRIYSKPSDAGLMLRLETEYKADRANAALKALADVGPGAIMSHEIRQTINHRLVTEAFSDVVGDDAYAVRVPVDTDNDKTYRWLRETVLTTFVRVLNTHPRGHDLADAYHKAITKAFPDG